MSFANRPMEKKDHGRWGRQYFGCHCEVCVEAAREYFRKLRGHKPKKTWTIQEIAEILTTYVNEGISVAVSKHKVSNNTIYKWAKEFGGVKYIPPVVHGTRNTYMRKNCRCKLCIEGNRKQLKATKEAMKKRAAQDAPHGTATGYVNWGCRCDLCKKAGSIKNKRRKRPRIERSQKTHVL